MRKASSSNLYPYLNYIVVQLNVVNTEHQHQLYGGTKKKHYGDQWALLALCPNLEEALSYEN
jgi:hypothetical protein